MSAHVVLPGDSIFDNGGCMPGHPAIAADHSFDRSATAVCAQP